MKTYASSTIVENRAGAGGRVVMDVLKNSPADGSVMVLTPAVAMALYPHVYKSLSYNPQAGLHSGYYHLHHGHGVCGGPLDASSGEDAG